MYLSMRSFKKALNDVIQSRRAIANMNSLYPNATAQELQETDNVCIICREEMVGTTIVNGQVVNPGSGLSKKLPCGHIFHVSCLRSWFQRQQTCPTCRLDVLRASVASRAQNLVNNNINNNNNVMNNPGLGGAAGLTVNVPQQTATAAPANLNLQQQQFLQQVFLTHLMMNQFGAQPTGQPQPSDNQPRDSNPAVHSDQTTRPPSFPGPLPSPPPHDLSVLSDSQLLTLIRSEREGLEARLKLYSQSRTLIDAAINNLLQFNAALEHGRPSQAVSSESGEAEREMRARVTIPPELVPTDGGRFLSDEDSVRKRSNSAIRRARVNKFGANSSDAASTSDTKSDGKGSGGGL